MRATKTMDTMPRKDELFWDVNPMTIDPEANAEYVIERIMDFGEDDDIRWMWRHYPRTLLWKVLQHSRVIHKKSKSLWEPLLKSGL